MKKTYLKSLFSIIITFLFMFIAFGSLDDNRKEKWRNVELTNFTNKDFINFIDDYGNDGNLVFSQTETKGDEKVAAIKCGSRIRFIKNQTFFYTKSYSVIQDATSYSTGNIFSGLKEKTGKWSIEHGYINPGCAGRNVCNIKLELEGKTIKAILSSDGDKFMLSDCGVGGNHCDRLDENYFVVPFNYFYF